MSDLRFSATLNDQGFKSGLDRMEKGVQGFAKSFKFLAGAAAVGRAFAMAEDAGRQLAESDQEAARAVRELDAAQARLTGTMRSAAIGVLNLKAGVADLLATMQEGVDPVSDWLADLFAGEGNSAALRQLRDVQAQQDLVQKRMMAERDAAREIERIRGDTERARFDLEFPADREVLSAGREAREQRERVLELTRGMAPALRDALGVERLLAEIGANANRVFEQRTEAMKRARLLRREELDADLQGLSAQSLKSDGRRREAEALERAVKVQQVIRKLEEDSALNARDKVRYIDAYRRTFAEVERAEEEREERERRRATGARVLGAGLTGSGAFADAVLGRGGAGPEVTVQRALLLSTRQQGERMGEAVEVLKSIERAVREQRPAFA